MRNVTNISKSGAAVLGAALAVVAATGGATLAGAPMAGAATGAGQLPGVLFVPRVVHSTFDAGYSAIDSQSITSFTGSLTVPTVTCPATGSRFLESAISMSSGPTADAGFGFSIECTAGVAHYSNSYADVNGASGVTAIAAGQTLKFSLVTNTSKGTVTATVSDPASGYAASATAKGPVALTSVDALTITTPSSPIATFSEVHFQNLKFNGATLSTLGSLQKSDRYNGTTLQISTTMISAKGTFSTVFEHT
jgi:Peptidase A4 family